MVATRLVSLGGVPPPITLRRTRSAGFIRKGSRRSRQLPKSCGWCHESAMNAGLALAWLDRSRNLDRIAKQMPLAFLFLLLAPLQVVAIGPNHLFEARSEERGG